MPLPMIHVAKTWLGRCSDGAFQLTRRELCYPAQPPLYMAYDSRNFFLVLCSQIQGARGSTQRAAGKNNELRQVLK